MLVWVQQDEHQIHATPDVALTVLRRLLRFNLTWGLLCYGMIFIPPLAISNYFAQKRLIDQQLLRS